MKNNYIFTALKGALIGTGAILPGVSGGVLCVALGVYRSVMELLTHPIRELKARPGFFIALLIGFLAGVLGLSRLVDLLFRASPVPAVWLFVGLIIGTLPSLWRQGASPPAPLSRGSAPAPQFANEQSPSASSFRVEGNESAQAGGFTPCIPDKGVALDPVRDQQSPSASNFRVEGNESALAGGCTPCTPDKATEGSVCPVGTTAKPLATRSCQPKRAGDRQGAPRRLRLRVSALDPVRGRADCSCTGDSARNAHDTTASNLRAGSAAKGGHSLSSILIGVLALGLMLAWLLYVRSSASATVPLTTWTWLLCGVLWGVGLIAPGMSPSSLFIFMGVYQPMAAGIADLNLSILLPMGAGLIACVLSLSHLINWLLKRHYAPTMHAILGVSIASTIVIIPFGEGKVFTDAIVYSLCFAAGLLTALWMDSVNRKMEAAGQK